MAKRYVMTPARKAALKKAQAASARKRRGTGKTKSRRQPDRQPAQTISVTVNRSYKAPKQRRNGLPTPVRVAGFVAGALYAKTNPIESRAWLPRPSRKKKRRVDKGNLAMGLIGAF